MLQELPVEDVVPLPVATGAQAAVSRRFTRVTFVGPNRRADVSVPDDLPAALVIEQVRPLLDAAAGDRWILTRPAGGDLGPEDTLAGAARSTANWLPRARDATSPVRLGRGRRRRGRPEVPGLNGTRPGRVAAEPPLARMAERCGLAIRRAAAATR